MHIKRTESTLSLKGLLKPGGMFFYVAPDTGRAAEPLAQFNSGDWGALLTGELGSVTAVLDQLGETDGQLGGRDSIGKLESFGSIQMLTRQRSGNVLTRMGSCNDSFAQLITPELVK